MKAKRVTAVMMAAAMSAALIAGCGSSDSSSDASSESTSEESAESTGVAAGTYTYRQTVANADEVEIPAYNFGGDNILASYLNAVSVELTLSDDGTFTLESKGWMTEDSDGSGEEPAALEYGSATYGEYTTSASGTYETEGDTVTIYADEVTHSIPDMGISYMAQIFSAGNSVGGSYNADGEDYAGEWSSADIAEVLELVPDTVFTIDGDTIVTWEKAGKIISIETDAASLIFYEGGATVYQDVENNLSDTTMTWSCDGESVTITNSYGEEFTGSVDAALEISLISYTDATTYNTYTQSLEITEDILAALQ